MFDSTIHNKKAKDKILVLYYLVFLKKLYKRRKYLRAFNNNNISLKADQYPL